MNNRLDFIQEFEDGAIELMTEVREKFIELDNALVDLWHKAEEVDGAARRVISIARTDLERGLQSAIKSICLIFEKKSEPSQE